jgi:hypothetical protein
MLDCDMHTTYGGVNLKKAAITILMFVILLAGCARPAVNTKLAPLAYIDSVSSAQIYVGEKVKFTGRAFSSTGQVVAYNWRSSANGPLSTLLMFETDTLTAGAHTIWFKAQDDYGNWSDEVSTNVNVLIPGGPEKMSVKVFTATPPSIKQGDWTNLSWDVSGYGSVRIDPDIGDVSMSGSRSVQPLFDTVYTVIARNDEGIVTASTRVTVTPLHLYTLVLYSIAAEDGTVRKDRVVLDEVMVGENELQVQMQGFLSFDLSAVPQGAIIKTVDLDLSKSVVVNSPFPWQGALDIYNQQFGNELKPNNYMVIVPAGYLYSWNYNFVATMMPDKSFTAPAFVTAVQKRVDLMDKRFQVRMQFEKYYYYTRQDYTSSGYQSTPYQTSANYLDVGSGNPILTIRYVLPE